MKVLVSGGRGFVGLQAAKALQAAGHEVRLLSSSSGGKLDGMTVMRGDVRDEASLQVACAGIEAVVIAHQFANFPIENKARHNTFMEVDAEGTRHLIAAAQTSGQPRKLVYLSGAAVNEDAPAHPGIVAKLKAEQYVRESGIPYTILRPSIVYGSGDHYYSRLAGFIERGPAVPTFGRGREQAQPIHNDDLAATIVAALEDERANNRTLDACGPDRLSTNQAIKLLGQVLGKQPRIVHLPVLLLTPLAAIIERVLPNPPLTPGLIAFARFDNTSQGINAAEVLGLHYRGLRQGLRQVYGNG